MNEVKEIFEKYANDKLVNVMLNFLETSGVTSGYFDYEDKITVHEAIKATTNFTSTFENGNLIIQKFETVAPIEKTYLRLGLLPENGKSVNHLTGKIENGVSVFELVDGKPVIDNLQLIDSLSGRHELPAFIVTGDRVGIGHDGEPILKNVQYVSKTNVDFTTLTIEALDNAFGNKTGSFDKDSKEIHQFYIDGYELSYAGYTYTKPKNGFNIKMGGERNI